MNTTIKPGDTVRVNAERDPILTYVVTELQTVNGDELACGPYGCIHVDLLTKIEPDALTRFPNLMTLPPQF